MSRKKRENSVSQSQVNPVSARVSALLKRTETAGTVTAADRAEFMALLNESDLDLASPIPYVADALRLADEIRADGVDLTSAEYACLAVILYTGGDRMIERYSLMRKLGRNLVAPTPPTVAKAPEESVTVDGGSGG